MNSNYLLLLFEPPVLAELDELEPLPEPKLEPDLEPEPEPEAELPLKPELEPEPNFELLLALEPEPERLLPLGASLS